MDLITAHRKAMAEFDAHVQEIKTDQWENSTPCSEWTVRDLLDHLVTEQLWAPQLLNSKTLDEIGDRFDGDVLGDDPVGAWRSASAAARRAWDTPGATTGDVHVTDGEIPAEEYGWQMTVDLAVHAWDLARGIGADDRMDDDLANTLHDRFAPQAERWNGAGPFAPPLPTAADADAQTRLLAALGRQR